VAGFDLFYSLFDVEHDRAERLRSWAVRWGETGVFSAARVHHLGTVALLTVAGLGLDVALAYWVGVGAVATLLLYEHSLIRPRPPPPRRGLLHGQRRDQHRLPLLRARRRARSLGAETALAAGVDAAAAPAIVTLPTQ